MSSSWLALEIGNSRLHWALFQGEELCSTWDTPHLAASVVQQLAQCQTFADLSKDLLSHPSFEQIGCLRYPCPIYLASVVPSQTALWQAHADVRVITLEQVPLQGVYPTLGIDRALALWGAGVTWGFPVLTIDAGTALTFTGADADRRLVGGAILPGLSLQLQSLGQTASLPLVEQQNILSLPQRWALNTPEAIVSGVIYTQIAGMADFIEAWWQEFPGSCICLKGGNANLLLTHMRSLFPQVASKVIADPHLIFWGMRSCWRI